MKFKFLIPLLLVPMLVVSCKNDSEPSGNEKDQNEQNSGEQGSEEDTPVVIPDMPAQNGSGETNGYRLVWEDTFDGTSLDETKWNIEVTNSPANNEIQAYRRQNVSIEVDPATGRSCLCLTARKESYGGKPTTSGRVNTQGKVAYKYGKVEAMIKLPKTYKGLWPAFWMMGDDIHNPGVGWPACGEIDIFEMGNSGGFGSVAKSEAYLNGATHCAPAGRWDADNCQYRNATWSYSLQDDFHLFTLIWDEQSLACYIDLDKYPDGEPYFSLDISQEGHEIHNDYSCWHVYCYFHKEFHVLLNLAVGGDFPGIKKVDGITALNEDNGYEARMLIDYVRIYQK